MEITTITTFLSPFLPTLVKLGSKVATGFTDGAAKQFGESAWNKAVATWEKLRPSLEEKETAQEAIADLEDDPEDEDNVAALRKQLKKVLEGDTGLLEEIASILQTNAPDGTPGLKIVQNVTGDSAQVIGQVAGGTVIGGSGNVSIKQE